MIQKSRVHSGNQKRDNSVGGSHQDDDLANRKSYPKYRAFDHHHQSGHLLSGAFIFVLALPNSFQKTDHSYPTAFHLE